ncbi:laccase [Fomitiporia mediterranea MF3/22]|uniref:laccase n=1 Tax=Fomitiporia mediterranea (strain MF3/22) TaxID=694068 RepID=UPI00044086CF|nr:laccase [Fomitiporia mediterranea MF3/22]EJD00070.1 laccase [Fomitiporia mediterranea MF3/22]
MAKLSLVSLLLTLTHPVFSATVTRSLDIVNDNVSPDGLTRPAILVNGSLPGPLISGNASDTFLVNVTDNLTDTTMYRGVSIHWHGLYQKGHAADDGASWVTQCPIIPNNSFLYNFTAANQTGTYWYHSHEGTQYCDGLRGPLVIYDPEDPHANLYDVDDETTVITLADWVIDTRNQFARRPPNSTLINGRGRYLDGPNVPLSVVNVTQGLRYRFRIVSVSCSPSFKFQIDGHNMTVIEADGIETEPVTVNALTIYAGQRYSVVVNASQPIGNYWIRAEPSASGAITGFENGINSAVLRYSGAAQEEPTTLQDTDDNPLNEADLVRMLTFLQPGEPRPGGVDLALNLDISLVSLLRVSSKLISFFKNVQAWENPATPVLLQILNGNTDLVPADSLYELPGNSTIELSMPGSFAVSKCTLYMHLHGHSFDIVRVAGSTEYNYKNPPRRDVVSMGDSGGDDKNNVTIRFVTDNAGPWFLHCHIDWHLASGLAVVFVEDRENINSVTHFSDEWKNLCPAYSANPPDATFS